MISKKQLLDKAKLYLILDRSVNSYEELFDIACNAIHAKVGIMQIRDKNGSAGDIIQFSKEIKKRTLGQIPFIVNDRVELAIQGGASGVHLGQEDMPVKEAREMIGDEAIIGVSCQTLEHAMKAQEQGADYIGFGSVFKTLTKPGRSPMDESLLRDVNNAINIPLFAIGGIDMQNMSQVIALGINRIAVCRAICQAGRVTDTIKQFKEGLVRNDALQAVGRA